jgi:hypothetical protein
MGSSPIALTKKIKDLISSRTRILADGIFQYAFGKQDFEGRLAGVVSGLRAIPCAGAKWRPAAPRRAANGDDVGPRCAATHRPARFVNHCRVAGSPQSHVVQRA